VLASEVFRPERTVFLCPQQVAQSKTKREKLEAYFRHRGLDTELIFVESSMLKADRIVKQLVTVCKTYPDCVVDITGGTDAALFACGSVCAQLNLPAFTYSRKRNSFYNIYDAPFAEEVPCTIQHTVEDCFLMAGGAYRPGRVDNGALHGYMDLFDPFFRVYMKHRSHWPRSIEYMQATSQSGPMDPVKLRIACPRVAKGDHGRSISAPDVFLRDLARIGMLKDLVVGEQEISYSFPDEQIRFWLRDIGSVLETYIYKACLDTGAFNDVRTSVVVDWEGDFRQDNVTNEIDVMAMKGIQPVFISCKTCQISTEALNELAILRDRFGGYGARAIMVTTQNCRTITRHRAAELHIDVIDWDDLCSGNVVDHLTALVNQPQLDAGETM